MFLLQFDFLFYSTACWTNDYLYRDSFTGLILTIECLIEMDIRKSFLILLPMGIFFQTLVESHPSGKSLYYMQVMNSKNVTYCNMFLQ